MVQFEEDYEASDNEVDEELQFEPVPQNYNFRQQGRQEIGDYHGDHESKRVEVEFPVAFPEGMTPFIFCQAEGELDQDYGDVFACTVIEDSVTETGFHVNVGRVGNNNWGQNLILNWVAMVSTNPMIQCYQVDAGACPHGQKAITVTCEHPKALPANMRPCVFAVPVGGDHADCFSVTVKKMNRQRVVFSVARGIDNRWGQNLKLNVLVCVDGVIPTLKLELGNSDEQFCKYEELKFGVQFPARPVPLVICQHQTDPGDWDDCFACCAGNVQGDGLQVNVGRTDRFHHGWGQSLRAHVLLFL